MPGRYKDCLMILAMTVGGFSPPIAAEIHKCTSKDGNVSFSDVACPRDADAQTLNIGGNSASGAPPRGHDSNPHPPEAPGTRLDRQPSKDRARAQPQRTDTSLIYQKWLNDERNATIRGAIPPEINPHREKTRTLIGTD